MRCSFIIAGIEFTISLKIDVFLLINMRKNNLIRLSGSKFQFEYKMKSRQ